MSNYVHVRTLILLVVAVAVLWLAFRSLRAGRLKERYVLLFAITGLPFLFFALWPDAIVSVSEFLEIEKPTLLVLSVTTYFILTTFELLSIVSVQDRKIATLGQEVAILQSDRQDASQTARARAEGRP